MCCKWIDYDMVMDPALPPSPPFIYGEGYIFTPYVPMITGRLVPKYCHRPIFAEGMCKEHFDIEKFRSMKRALE
jgi:hypothetical protein